MLPKIRMENPVLVKEMRTRMRGARAFWLLFGHLILLSVVLFTAYVNWYLQNKQGYQPVWGGTPLGRQLFQVLFVAQAAMITLLTPALTAGMLTLEKEQQSFDLLILTTLRRRQIIAGKLLSAFGFVTLLLTASLPLAGICFLMGGVAPQEVAAVYVVLALSSLVYGGLGILFSASLRGTVAATGATYMAVLLFALPTGAFAAGGMEFVLSAVSPIAAAYNAMFAPAVFRAHWHLPNWVTAIAVNALLALITGIAAVDRLEGGDDRRRAVLRWLGWALFSACAVACIGNTFAAFAMSGGAHKEMVVVVCIMALIVLAVLTLVYCTGHPSEPAAAAPAGVAGGRRRRRDHLLTPWPLSGGYASGPAFVMLLLATYMGTLALGFGISRVPPASLKGTWEAFTAMFLVMAACLACYAALARLYTVLASHRVIAIVFTFLTVVAMMLLPLLNYVGWDAHTHPPHQLAWETLYLCPAMALFSLLESPGQWPNSVPAVWAGQDGTLAAIVVVHLLLATFLELTGQGVLAWRRRQKRTGGRSEQEARQPAAA